MKFPEKNKITHRLFMGSSICTLGTYKNKQKWRLIQMGVGYLWQMVSGYQRKAAWKGDDDLCGIPAILWNWKIGGTVNSGEQLQASMTNRFSQLSSASFASSTARDRDPNSRQ